MSNANSDSSIGADLLWEFPRVSGATYATMGHLIEASLPDLQKEVMKDRSLNQGDRYTPKFSGFIDAGKISAKLSFLKTDHVKLITCIEDKLSYWFKIFVPDAPLAANQSFYLFKAFLAKMTTPLSENGDRMLTDIELDIDGKPTFTAGT